MVCSDVYNGETASTVLSAEIRCFDLGDVFLAFCQGVWWCTSNTVWFGAGQLIILSFPGNGCEWLWIIWLLRCYILVVSNLKVSVHEDIRPITIIIHHSHNSRFFTRLNRAWLPTSLPENQWDCPQRLGASCSLASPHSLGIFGLYN